MTCIWFNFKAPQGVPGGSWLHWGGWALSVPQIGWEMQIATYGPEPNQTVNHFPGNASRTGPRREPYFSPLCKCRISNFRKNIRMILYFNIYF